MPDLGTNGGGVSFGFVAKLRGLMTYVIHTTYSTRCVIRPKTVFCPPHENDGVRFLQMLDMLMFFCVSPNYTNYFHAPSVFNCLWIVP